MLFSSMTFIYVFLPVVFFSYLLVRKNFRNMILLIASIIFYAWGEPKYLVIMLLNILINYFGAIFIEKYNNYKQLTLISTIILNLAFLIYFKYFNFLITNFNNLFSSHVPLLNIIMPLGISFYTFQALSYVIDVYRAETKAQHNIYKLALYICLFPQLIAGPIVKYHDVAEQIEDREVNFSKINMGIKRFIIGLSKKVLIANTMGAVADKIFVQDPHNFPHILTWLGSICYSLQIYFDFCGYSDMAIGLGLIFGFKFLENFNYPYISKSISEFWRRWHISLSTWFKQYVYIPLGGNRQGKTKTLRNLGIVFLLTGIWHGAEWTFVVWGIWHGFFIILEKIFNIKDFDAKTHPFYINTLRHFYCLFVVLIGWIIFRADNLKYAWDYILSMFWLLPLNKLEFLYQKNYYFGNIEQITLICAILCCIPIFKNILNIENIVVKVLVNTWLLILFFLSTVMLAANTYNPFIYFRF